ncbi:MAG TPA: hypothetical protein VIM16_20775 [Mucilaginibacter sp.]|jgi:hypothetical protein
MRIAPLGDNRRDPFHNPPPPPQPYQGILPNTGPLNDGWWDSADNGGAPPAYDDGSGLYNSNSTAYWGLYNATDGTFRGTSIYHAGNGTAGDPSTGSQAAAIAAINTVGTTSGVNLYDGVDGVVTGMQQNTPGISYQMTPLRDLDSPSSALKGDNM